MQFNSFIFILLFLPLTVTLYYALNKINDTVGKIVLLIASIIFYAYTDRVTLIVLGISLVLNYGFALAIANVKKWRSFYLFTPIVINTGILLYFKYLNFVIENVNHFFMKSIPLKEMILPIGISFFTFQQIAYMVAVYRKEIEKIIYWII